MNQTFSDKYNEILDYIKALGTVAVAYSGGTDSTLLARAAVDALGERAVAVTIKSPSLPASELAEAISVAAGMGIRHVVLDGNEMSDPRYVENSPQRCYYCKFHNFSQIRTFAADGGFERIVDGHNADDSGDYRPGHRAASELDVLSPLKDLNIGKSLVRQLAREQGLANWNKAASACLASRIPYGSSVTSEKLRQIEEAEAYLKSLGLSPCRVRHHGNLARIEIQPEDFDDCMKARIEVDEYFRKLGFVYVALDLAGFRSGSMNLVLEKTEPRNEN